MVNAASPSTAPLSTKALAAAGQFRAIALWLNEPLIPQGIYVQVQPDKRPGRLLLVAEFERPPNPTRLTQLICHLVWQLNSPLIEGIYLIARLMGQSTALWERRVRVMTPALRERWQRQQQARSQMPPRLARSQPPSASDPGSPPQAFMEHVKTLRAFMLTGSAVAAFVFGCMAEVLLSARQEPSLPFQERQSAETELQTDETWWEADPRSPEPQLPVTDAILTPRQSTPVASEAVTTISYKVEPERDRPNVVNGALEAVGVIEHERVPQPGDPTVTLVFGGDVDLDDLPYSLYESDGQLLAGVPSYQSADVAMVNLEDPLATAATSLEEELIERQRPDAINLLKAGGVDIVNLTNDTTLAHGETGLTETLDTLDSHGVYRVGAGRSQQEARRPEILDVKGQRIAYLSYNRTDTLAAGESFAGVNAPSKNEIIRDIRAIRDEVDWLVVNYRWTEDLPEKPADFQTNLARLAIEQGADLVVGHHPTQLQGAEIYKGRPIAYSLGDFVFSQPTDRTTPASAVLQVSLRAGQMKVDLIPVKVQGGQPYQLSGAEGDAILGQIKAASQEFAQPLPASIVLDARSDLPGEDEVSAPDGSFVDDTESSAPIAPEPTTAPSEPDAPALTVPLEADDNLDIQIDPIPDGLLDEWGPKEGTGSIYDPESILPNGLRPQRPAIAEPSPQPRLSPDAPDLPAEVEISHPETKSSPPDAIAPYSEPLVGPMSTLPSSQTPRTTKEDAIAHPSKLSLSSVGAPQTRILKPVKTLPSTDELSASRPQP